MEVVFLPWPLPAHHQPPKSTSRVLFQPWNPGLFRPNPTGPRILEEGQREANIPPSDLLSQAYSLQFIIQKAVVWLEVGVLLRAWVVQDFLGAVG